MGGQMDGWVGGIEGWVWWMKQYKGRWVVG